MHGKKCMLHMIAFVLLLIGGLNWGLVGLFDFDLVKTLFGAWPIVVKVVYVLIGLSALLMPLKGKCKGCKTGGGEGSCCAKKETPAE